MAGVALGDIDLHFACQAWHLVTSTCTLQGRRGTYGTEALVARLLPGDATWRHPRALCLAGVALMALGWLWWRAWFPVTPLDFAWQAWHLATSTFTLRGTRGTW